MHLIWNKTSLKLWFYHKFDFGICACFFWVDFIVNAKKKIFRQSNTCFPLKVTTLIWLNLSWKWQKNSWQNIRNLEHIKSDIVYKTWTWFSPLTYFYPFDEQWIEGKLWKWNNIYIFNWLLAFHIFINLPWLNVKLILIQYVSTFYTDWDFILKSTRNELSNLMFVEFM